MKSNIGQREVRIAHALVDAPGAAYSDLALTVGCSQSSAHGAVKRLQRSRIVNAERRVIPTALAEFMRYAFPYLFPKGIKGWRAP
jgi:predicted transcriptional regulator